MPLRRASDCRKILKWESESVGLVGVRVSGFIFVGARVSFSGFIFTALMEAVKIHSLGQISHARYDVGGEYRRNM